MSVRDLQRVPVDSDYDPGDRIGDVVLVRAVGRDRWGSTVWEARCACGALFEARLQHLVGGGVQSCGCRVGAPMVPYTGTRRGTLVCTEDHGETVTARCDCGAEVTLDRAYWCGRGSVATHTGCPLKRYRGRPVDLVGERVGHLVVLARADNGPRGEPRWLCRCDYDLGTVACGRRVVVWGAHLRAGRTQSCGHHRAGGKRRRN